MAAPPPNPAMWQAAVHVFLEQFAHSMWEPGWAKRTLSPNIRHLCSDWGFLLLLTEMQTKKRAATVVTAPTVPTLPSG